MNAIDLSRNATGLLTRINQITGWRLPENEKLIKVLEAEFTEYLSTNAADMNSKEVISAVRMHGLGIIEWGKSMNLSFIDQCIILYKSERAELSKAEERAAIDQKQAKTEELPAGPVDWSEKWNAVIYGAKMGQIKNMWISTDLYDWLIRVGKIVVPDPADKVACDADKADKWEIMRQCAKVYLMEIEDALLTGAGIEPPYEIKRRINLLKNEQAPIWKKDTAIMSTLTVMAKKEMVRQLALSECLNEME